MLTITVSSCHREDYFYEIDDAPLFVWNGHTNLIAPAYLSDTIKIQHQQVYEYICTDVHVKAPDLAVTKTVGEFDYEFGDGVLKIEAYSEGIVEGKFTATDIYGKSSELFFTIKAFYNVKPVAKGEVRAIKNLNECEIEIDLSQSYDGDSKQGGGIVQYQYKIISPTGNEYNLVSPLNKISYIFKEKGLATIEFRVCDNDEEWSDWVTAYIKV